jgi:hypothetical protein
VKLGAENRKTVIVAAVLGVLAILTIVHEFMPSSSTIASTGASPGVTLGPSSILPHAPGRRGSGAGAGKKERTPQSLDPTLRLDQLAATEQIKYEGSGRNIFVAQAEVEIPKPLTPGTIGSTDTQTWHPPAVSAPLPIPLKFFGFASQPGEPKKIFLSKGEDVFIAGEGEIIDRRYKVVRISPTSVEIQDVVGSGPPQSIPLTQG